MLAFKLDWRGQVFPRDRARERQSPDWRDKRCQSGDWRSHERSHRAQVRQIVVGVFHIGDVGISLLLEAVQRVVQVGDGLALAVGLLGEGVVGVVRVCGLYFYTECFK